MARFTYPTREALRRLPFNLADLAVIAGILALLYGIARVGAGTFVSFHPPENTPHVSLSPVNLPYYAGRSVLRMFVALGVSTTFTLLYGYIAARSAKAERILVPLLDILQSVPVLGFLTVTVSLFIALFPGSLLGLEAAAVFAIFTSQAWNMTFSFYQSLRTQPRELSEVVRMYRLPAWQRFTRLDVPSAMIGLVWNGMMSFGGGWFFLAASEAISVLNQNYQLPGIGSYVAAAVQEQDLGALGLALLTMAVVIVLVDQLFWRPLVAWADKFKLEQRSASAVPRSWLLDLLLHARLPRLVGQALTPATEAIDRLLSRITPARPSNGGGSGLADRVYDISLLALIASVCLVGSWFILFDAGLSETGYAALLGLATMTRVVVLVIISTLIWVPVGVAIGFSPRLSGLLQPVVQLLASFPANFLFPFLTIFLIHTGISINIGGVFLMALGAQWYILFNTIAGASSIPTDLREMAAILGLRRWKLWQALIIPGIFSAWVTGGITAAGGAWNASIIAETVSWGGTTLAGTGLGAYIAEATESGDWPKIVLGIGVMSAFVVSFNRLFWRRLYRLAEERFTL